MSDEEILFLGILAISHALVWPLLIWARLAAIVYGPPQWPDRAMKDLERIWNSQPTRAALSIPGGA